MEKKKSVKKTKKEICKCKKLTVAKNASAIAVCVDCGKMWRYDLQIGWYEV